MTSSTKNSDGTLWEHGQSEKVSTLSKKSAALFVSTATEKNGQHSFNKKFGGKKDQIHFHLKKNVTLGWNSKTEENQKHPLSKCSSRISPTLERKLKLIFWKVLTISVKFRFSKQFQQKTTAVKTFWCFISASNWPRIISKWIWEIEPFKRQRLWDRNVQKNWQLCHNTQNFLKEDENRNATNIFYRLRMIGF